MEILEPHPEALSGIKLAIPTLTTANRISKAQDSNIRKGEKSTQASLRSSRTTVSRLFQPPLNRRGN